MNNLSKFSLYITSLVSGICSQLVLLGTITAQAATYYVAMTGSDSNPGTLSRPFKSFSQGIRMLEPGDTLYIRGGLYTEQIDLQTPKKTGTVGNYITIAGYPGETVTIRHASSVEASYGNTKARGNRGFIIFENLVLDGTDLGDKTQGISLRDGNHDFILRNLEIKNHKGTGLGINADNIQVINCKIHDNITVIDQPGDRHYGIYYRTGGNIMIEGNDIYNNDGGGITAYPGPISNATIRNNNIHHNNRLISSQVEGIQLVKSSTTTIVGVRIYNNVIYMNGVNQPDPSHSGGIRIDGANNTTIWNNTIYGNKGWGIAINGSGSANTLVQNNIVFANTRGQIVDRGTSSIMTHNLTTDPKFVNTDAFDFRLQADSSAIDEGINLNQISTDFRGITRPQGVTHDIGAYEGSVSDYHPQAPQALSIK